MTWRWFWFVWRGQGADMAWLLIGSALSAAMHAGFAWSWKGILDSAQAATGTGADEGALARAGLLCLGIGAAQALLYISVQGTRARVNERIQQAARRRVLAHLAAVEPGALAAWRTGDLVTRLTDDVSTEKLAWFLCSGVFRAYEALLIVMACLIGMAWIDPALTVWAVSPLPLLVLAQVVAGRELGRRADRVQQSVARVGAVVQDVFDGVRVVQARGLQGLARRAFAAAAADQVEAEVSNARLAQYVLVQFGYGWQVALAALLFAGGARVMDGTLGVGDFVAFNGFVLALVFPMFDFGAFVVRLRQAAASLERLDALLALSAAVPPRAAEANGEVRLPARIVTPHLSIEMGVPMEFGIGDLVAVTGPVGSGKSTLLTALAGQLPLRAPLPTLPAPAWVPQDPVILAASVGENICLDTLLADAVLAEGQEGNWSTLLEAACLTDDVGRWPAGIGTLVGERGVTLSGGQQQRVQIARGFAARRSVLLLDDATSALDADTEARFWDGFSRRDQIVFVVTHRAATLARATVVLYLRDGRLAGRGTHAELVASYPAYRAAYGAEETIRSVPTSASPI